MNGIDVNHVGNTSPWLSGRNLTSSTQGLSKREKEIMKEIENMVGGPVKLNLGTKCETSGFTIAFKGFGGASASGVRDPFMITPDMLKEMAGDEGKYNRLLPKLVRALEIDKAAN